MSNDITIIKLERVIEAVDKTIVELLKIRNELVSEKEILEREQT